MSIVKDYINDNKEFGDHEYGELAKKLNYLMYAVFQVKPILPMSPQYGNASEIQMASSIDALMMHVISEVGNSLQRKFDDRKIRKLYDIWMDGNTVMRNRVAIDKPVKTGLLAAFNKHFAEIAEKPRGKRATRRQVDYAEESDVGSANESDWVDHMNLSDYASDLERIDPDLLDMYLDCASLLLLNFKYFLTDLRQFRFLPRHVSR